MVAEKEGRKMSLIACSECGRQFSSLAKACPGCGAPSAVSLPPKDSQSRKDKNVVIIAVVVVAIGLLLLAAAGGPEAVVAIVGLIVGVLLIWLLFLWPIFAGNQLGAKHGHPNIGAFIGFVGGWIGVAIYYLVLPPTPNDTAIPAGPFPPQPPRLDRKQAVFDAWASHQEALGKKSDGLR
jgi:rRNA maturation protein Nop10